jgi:hypothetical protein
MPAQPVRLPLPFAILLRLSRQLAALPLCLARLPLFGLLRLPFDAPPPILAERHALSGTLLACLAATPAS